MLVAAVIQAIATSVLTVITFFYARSARVMSRATDKQITQSQLELEQLREQVKISREAAELEARPNLIFTLKFRAGSSCSLEVVNLGKYAAFISRVRLELTMDFAVSSNRRFVVGPSSSGSVDLGPQKDIAAILQRSDGVKWPMMVEFFYGPTGTRLHWYEHEVDYSKGLGATTLRTRHGVSAEDVQVVSFAEEESIQIF